MDLPVLTNLSSLDNVIKIDARHSGVLDEGCNLLVRGLTILVRDLVCRSVELAADLRVVEFHLLSELVKLRVDLRPGVAASSKNGSKPASTFFWPLVHEFAHCGMPESMGDGGRCPEVLCSAQWWCQPAGAVRRRWQQAERQTPAC